METIYCQHHIFFTLIPVEAREHGDEEGRRVEEEKAREEGAQPGECEEGGADQGEVEHGRGGLHGQGHGQRVMNREIQQGETFMVARE